MSTLQLSMEFLLEMDRLKAIYRKAKIKPDKNRRENSAEHSWHVAVAAQVLAEHIDLDIDMGRVVPMLLIHDIVEIYAGDMHAFQAPKDRESQKLREHQAIETLYAKFNLKQVSRFKVLWEEFEACETDESKFARAIDRLVPFIQNINNDGGSWSEFGTTKSQILKHNSVVKELSAELWTYVNTQLDYAVRMGWVLDDLRSAGAEESSITASDLSHA